MRAAATDPPPTAPSRSMLKRLFDRQLLRISPAERLPSAGEKDEAEPSSVCLDGMVRSFMEDGVGSEKTGHGGRYCNCFHGGDNSDDEEDEEAAVAASDVAETIKKLELAICRRSLGKIWLNEWNEIFWFNCCARNANGCLLCSKKPCP